MADKNPDEFKPPSIHIEDDGADFPLNKLTGRSPRMPANQPRKQDEGRVPPQATDIEQSVLGAILIDPESLPNVIEILQPDDFYDLRHRHIYEGVLRLFEKSNPVDLITLKTELARFEKLELVGGSYYLTELSTKVATAANVEFHSRIVAEKSLMRKLIDGLTGVVKQAYEPETDPFDLLDAAEQSIFAISENNLRNSAQSLKDVIKETLAHLESIQGRVDGITGVPTGFHVLDQMTSGWQKSDLIIVAARPSMGKTAFALSMIQNAAINKKNPTGVVVFSLEMSAAQLAQRLLTAEARVDAQEARTGRLSDESFSQLAQAAGRLSKAPIFIDDTPALSIMELRAKCRRLKAEHDIGLVVVDYLQLMTAGNAGGKGGNREQEIALISRSLKALAKEINVPVIALAQLSRAVEQRGGDKRPQLSDLRESGCVTGDTLVLNLETGERIPILEMKKRFERGEMFSAFSLWDNFKLEKRPISNVFYSGKKAVFEIQTKTGKKIKASANHPFLKLEGWVRLDQLKIGDKVATPRILSVPIDSSPIKKDEIVLLAHLLGDGCILPKQPYHYTSADLENLEVVKLAAKRLFDINARLVEQSNWYHLYLSSPYPLTKGKKHPITIWYDALQIERVRSYDKRIPYIVFQQSNTKIALFLKHLWATDGNISWVKKNNKSQGVAIYYATSSNQLAEQVQHLLLRFGVVGSLKKVEQKGYRAMYHVHIQGAESQIQFLEQVGCYGERGSCIADMVLFLKQVKFNPNLDIVPKEIWHTYIKEAKQEYQLSWRSISMQLGMAYSGSSLFNSGVSRARLSRIAHVLPNPILKNLANSDVYWDEILSITPLGIEDVYDLTVDKTHNFVANDFIIHNSIEQDADLVGFIYRAERYGITVDDNGNSTEGTAEIIIAKQRNGPIGHVTLAFVNRYARFENLTTFYADDQLGYGGGSGGGDGALPPFMPPDDAPF